MTYLGALIRARAPDRSPCQVRPGATTRNGWAMSAPRWPGYEVREAGLYLPRKAGSDVAHVDGGFGAAPCRPGEKSAAKEPVRMCQIPRELSCGNRNCL
jgi:hypothetical protein